MARRPGMGPPRGSAAAHALARGDPCCGAGDCFAPGASTGLALSVFAHCTGGRDAVRAHHLGRADASVCSGRFCDSGCRRYCRGCSDPELRSTHFNCSSRRARTASSPRQLDRLARVRLAARCGSHAGSGRRASGGCGTPPPHLSTGGGCPHSGAISGSPAGA